MFAAASVNSCEKTIGCAFNISQRMTWYHLAAKTLEKVQGHSNPFLDALDCENKAILNGLILIVGKSKMCHLGN